MKRLMKRRSANSKGFTILELSVVLVIMALGIAGVVSYIGDSGTNQKVTEALQDMGKLRTVIEATYGAQGNYSTLSNAEIVNSKRLSASMIQGGVIRNAFNGNVTLSPANIGGGTANGYTIQFDQVSTEACNSIATYDLGTSVVQMTFNGTTFTEVPSVAAAATACGAAGGSVSMSWQFYG